MINFWAAAVSTTGTTGVGTATNRTWDGMSGLFVSASGLATGLAESRKVGVLIAAGVRGDVTTGKTTGAVMFRTKSSVKHDSTDCFHVVDAGHVRTNARPSASQ